MVKSSCAFLLLCMLVAAAAEDVPTCRFRNDENGLYTCYLTEGAVIVNEGESVEIQGDHDPESSLTDDSILRLYSEEPALEAILPALFKKFKNLQIAEFPKGIFQNISSTHFTDCAKLEKFVINKGAFKVITPKTFSACASLKELDLGDNAINSLDKESFADLTGLTTLKLNGNRLTSIPSNTFDALTALKILDVSGNGELSKFEDNLLRNNVNLEELSIARNKFSILRKEFFEGLANLKQLDATSSKVNAIEEAVFDKLSSLETALFKSNECIDKDYVSYRPSDKDEFQKCIDNFGNGGAVIIASKIALLVALALHFVR